MTVEVTPRDPIEAEVWSTTLEVARLFEGLSWMLIGAQMVMLLEAEAGRPSGRTTGDVDTIVDVRAVATSTRAATNRLLAAGFAQATAEHPYRLVRGDSKVDVLAPDNLGRSTDLTTVPPGVTTEIPGGSRALATRRVIDLRVADAGRADIPVPSVPGALVLKVRAWEARRERRDVEDLVRLLSLVVDVERVRQQLKPSERSGLGRIPVLTDASSTVWSVVPDADDARAAFARLSD